MRGSSGGVSRIRRRIGPNVNGRSKSRAEPVEIAGVLLVMMRRGHGADGAFGKLVNLPGQRTAHARGTGIDSHPLVENHEELLAEQQAD